MMHVASYTEGLNEHTYFALPAARRTERTPARSYSMALRVIDEVADLTEPSPTYDVRARLRLFDRLRLFTARLGEFALETTPLLGNGRRLAVQV